MLLRGADTLKSIAFAHTISYAGTHATCSGRLATKRGHIIQADKALPASPPPPNPCMPYPRSLLPSVPYRSILPTSFCPLHFSLANLYPNQNTAKLRAQGGVVGSCCSIGARLRGRLQQISRPARIQRAVVHDPCGECQRGGPEESGGGEGGCYSCRPCRRWARAGWPL